MIVHNETKSERGWESQASGKLQKLAVDEEAIGILVLLCSTTKCPLSFTLCGQSVTKAAHFTYYFYSNLFFFSIFSPSFFISQLVNCNSVVTNMLVSNLALPKIHPSRYENISKVQILLFPCPICSPVLRAGEALNRAFHSVKDRVPLQGHQT